MAKRTHIHGYIIYDINKKFWNCLKEKNEIQTIGNHDMLKRNNNRQYRQEWDFFKEESRPQKKTFYKNLEIMISNQYCQQNPCNANVGSRILTEAIIFE